ncbi:uncharacterized protein LODBEIA_P41000 [Lodderomyces beijingensis]|uniref:Major facilitator superfamily (MFS) profile domain-containing protein n=1 Tax=Lodderomyces beijingensis TaxID=1775926 RepID=A0ABP0ZS10_9ASCO
MGYSNFTKPFAVVRNALWGVPPSDPKERRYLLKLDIFVLSYVCLMYWVNYLDRANVSNAYVSGMKQDLNMGGDDFNLVNTIFYIGYIISMVPHNMILLKVRPRYWLTICAAIWSILTLATYKVTHFYQLCVIRFFQAMFESCIFGGVHLILGSYYTNKKDLIIRSFVFTSSGLVGQIFSGVIQAAVHKTMNGWHGLASWRVLFIMDFICSFPIVIYGFIFFPDAPDVGKPFYFTEEEHQMALAKMTKPKYDKFNTDLIRRIFGRWHWYLFSMLWIVGAINESFATNSIFALWLNHYNYSVEDRNHFPMGVFAVGVLATALSAYYIRYVGNGKSHWHVSLAIAAVMVISPVIQLCKPFDKTAVFVAQYLSGVSYAAQTVSFSWANVVCANDLQERAIVISSMNMLGNCMNAWWSITFFGAKTAPRFRNGAIALISSAAATLFVVGLIAWLQMREDKRRGGIVDTFDAVEAAESGEDSTCGGGDSLAEFDEKKLASLPRVEY